MNILVKAVQEAMYIIPEEVLIETFIPKYNNYNAPAASMEEQILSTVVRPRVIPDASLAKGEHMFINLSDVKPRYTDEWRLVYEIPERKLFGKTILSVLDISYSPMVGVTGSYGYAYGGVGSFYSQDVMTATTQMVQANSAIPNVASAKVDIIGENTIVIEDAQRFSTAYHLSCYVTDNDYLNKIDPRNYPHFSRLVEYAVKAHIYRKLRIRIDKGYIEGGSEIGAFKEVVMEYADSEENYRTYLREKWAKAAFIDSRSRYHRFIRSQVPVGL